MPVILHKWNELITNRLNPLTIDFVPPGESESKDIIHQVATESKRVPGLLVDDILHRPDVRDKQHYVRVHQAMLIRLLNKVFTYKQAVGLGENLLGIYQSFIAHLEYILNFTEDIFGDYFDKSETVPVPYFFVSTGELCRQLVLLKEKFQTSTEIDSTLVTILINNFHNYCNGEKTTATYNELHYQRDLMKELLSEKAVPLEASIREVLFFFNFNDDDYVAYLYKRLTALTEDQPTKRDKIAALRYEQKTINQMSTKLNTVLNRGMPALKEQVSHWIEEEIKFLEAAPVPETLRKGEAEGEDKIQTSLSVAKLALLLRLMVIDKIITNRVVAQVLRIIVKTVATLHTENISFGSLETKYHNPDRGTITAVKDMLFRWI
ncbi:MAG TPA: hypothetical protein VEY06_04825, partial [Flavisolibacter sp.]|nr:hypothetical protein [Flavisolibacter sp.]